MENQGPTSKPTSSTPPSSPPPAGGSPPSGPGLAHGSSGSSGGSGSDPKALAILGYIFPVLFFLPLLGEAKSNRFARFHANQQLILLIWYVIANVIVIIPLLGWLASPLMMIYGIIAAVIGIVNVSQGAQKRLPLIGKFTLLK